MILASAYYMFIVFATLTLTSTTGNMLDIWLSRIAFFTITFLLPQISFNYLDFHEKAGLNKFKTPTKILIIILLDIFLIFTIGFAFALLFALIDALFK